MPALPTITVTEAQMSRLINAFPGNTDAEKVGVYRAWLVQRLIEFVMKHELAELEQMYTEAIEDLDEQKRVRTQEIIESLRIVT